MARSFGDRRARGARALRAFVHHCGRAAGTRTARSRVIGAIELPKKMKRGALRSVLSERLREGNLFVIDDFNLDAIEVKGKSGEALAGHKTKKFLNVTKSFGWDGKTLIVETKPAESLLLSSRNVEGVNITTGKTLNIYEVLYHDRIVFTRAAISAVEERLS